MTSHVVKADLHDDEHKEQTLDSTAVKLKKQVAEGQGQLKSLNSQKSQESNC